MHVITAVNGCLCIRNYCMWIEEPFLTRKLFKLPIFGTHGNSNNQKHFTNDLHTHTLFSLSFTHTHRHNLEINLITDSFRFKKKKKIHQPGVPAKPLDIYCITYNIACLFVKVWHIHRDLICMWAPWQWTSKSHLCDILERCCLWTAADAL